MGNLLQKVIEIQGYLIDHPTFGRELRVVQMNICTALEDEIVIWSDTLRLRRQVLSKHWNYGLNEGSILSSNPPISSIKSESAQKQSYSQEQEMAWRLGSLAPITQPPILYCSFDKRNSVLGVPGSIIETENGVSLSQHPSILPSITEAPSSPIEPPTKKQIVSDFMPLQALNNLNIVFYGNSFRELTPRLTNKIPRIYTKPKRTLRK